MEPESIPDLLARLEREHVQAAYVTASGEPCCLECQEAWPCDFARLVAHARSLERVLTELTDALDTEDVAVASIGGLTWGQAVQHTGLARVKARAALGEAQ